MEGKYADKFWFSLFHELAHIIYGHIGQSNGTSEEDEKIADIFARDTLIPRKEYDSFVQLKKFDRDSIISFSQKIGIDVGIIIGRLQKENYIEYACFNNLKTKYEYSPE